MNEQEFDQALVGAAMAMAAEQGWGAVSVAGAARAAGLPLEQARRRFPGRHRILLALGRIADEAALADPAPEGTARDRLFDLLMRRIDVFQAHRDGVLALMRALPTEPATAALLACATQRSMGWMLEAAGVPATGLRGALRVKGLTAVWLWTMRAWQGDASPDLSATMATLDDALNRAAPLANWLNGTRGTAMAPADGDALADTQTDPHADHGTGADDDATPAGEPAP